jgi:hypothetical protein
LDKVQVQNPDALGQKEKELWLRIEPILNKLLEELKANGKIETYHTPSEVNHLIKIIENSNTISNNNNLLIHAHDKDKASRFLNAMSEFGFNDLGLAHLYLEVGTLLLIQDFECFKILLLFHLKDVDFRVSNFYETMRKSAPNAWKKLKPELDNKFRNSLSHGLWAIENKEIVLFEDAKLVPFAKLSLAKFIIGVKTQNVLYACLMNVLTKKGKENFFVC